MYSRRSSHCHCYVYYVLYNIFFYLIDNFHVYNLYLTYFVFLILIMVIGQLFHIDFGHFLGNFKWKLGVRRERQPFVFSPEMAYVVSEDYLLKSSLQYAEFEGICCRAYNILRNKANFLITLFALMLPAGMPELNEREAINYLRDMLSLDKTDVEANEKLRLELKNCLNSFTRQLDNWLHNLKHK